MKLITTLPIALHFEEFMNLRGECYRHVEGRLTQRIELNDNSYFIKQHTGVGWKEILKNLLQLRLPVLSAANEWQAIQKLEQLNIRVPKVIAFGQLGKNPAAIRSFILLEELKPIISLEDLCKEWPHKKPSFAFKIHLLQQVAEIARTLHQNGINHRDFYICHFLLDITGGLEQVEQQQSQLALIDLHRAQIRRLTPRRWIIKDLAGLYFSSMDIGLTMRDRLRFIRWYSQKPLRETLSSQKVFWQKIKARGEQLYRDHSK